MKRKHKKLLCNLLLSFICLLIPLGVFEAYLRITGYNPFKELTRLPVDGRDIILQPSKIKERGYELKPNAKGVVFGTQVSINSYGFRDKEYSLKKNDNTYRIIVLGDSTTFANWIPQDKTYPEILENLFRSSKKDVEVLNFGLGGYDTLKEVATLDHIGIQFHPELVIVAYCINDIWDTSPNLEYIQQAQRYSSFLYKLRIAQFIRCRLDRKSIQEHLKHSNIYEEYIRRNKDYITDISNDPELKQLMSKIEKEIHETNIPNYGGLYGYMKDANIGKLRYSFERLNRLKKENNFKVLVMILPFFEETKEDKHVFQTAYSIVEYESKRLGFDVLNLYDTFQPYGFLPESTELTIDNIHPNMKGHELIAGTLYKYLIEWRKADA